MRFLILFLLLVTYIFAEISDVNSTNALDINSTKKMIVETPIHAKTDIIEIKDESGLSDAQLRKVADVKDEERKDKISIKKVFENTDINGTVDLSKIQEKWEKLSPKADKFDWLQTKSGEWFKGKIKALYNDELEFDSDEIGLHTFDFDDVTQIKSYNIVSVNIEDVASVAGIIRLNGDNITIIQGDNVYEFPKNSIVSFAPDGEKERNYWSGNMTLSFDIRSGNINQADYSAKINLQRRTAISRLLLDYFGRTSIREEEEIANDHRVNQKYDIYLSRHFFWTPLFSEYYTDKYRNIDTQFTAGIGVGYTLLDTKKIDWTVSGGPAFLYTRYYTVTEGREIDAFSPAVEFSTKYKTDLTKVTSITYDYKLTYTDKESGVYKHHMLVTFENELTSWLDLDITSVWDYILEPQESSDTSIPKQSDFQVLLGLSVEF